MLSCTCYCLYVYCCDICSSGYWLWHTKLEILLITGNKHVVPVINLHAQSDVVESPTLQTRFSKSLNIAFTLGYVVHLNSLLVRVETCDLWHVSAYRTELGGGTLQHKQLPDKKSLWQIVAINVWSWGRRRSGLCGSCGCMIFNRKRCVLELNVQSFTGIKLNFKFVCKIRIIAFLIIYLIAMRIYICNLCLRHTNILVNYFTTAMAWCHVSPTMSPAITQRSSDHSVLGRRVSRAGHQANIRSLVYWASTHWTVPALHNLLAWCPQNETIEKTRLKRKIVVSV